jgi:hypothetical protein
MRVQCGHEGCTKTTDIESRTRREQSEDFKRYGNGKWRCERHRRHEEVLSPTDRKRVTDWSVHEVPHGKYWQKQTGVVYGPGFRAFAADYPEGTIIRVTAEIILPEATTDGR